MTVYLSMRTRRHQCPLLLSVFSTTSSIFLVEIRVAVRAQCCAVGERFRILLPQPLSLQPLVSMSSRCRLPGVTFVNRVTRD
jgi:hypothetical protein